MLEAELEEDAVAGAGDAEVLAPADAVVEVVLVDEGELPPLPLQDDEEDAFAFLAFLAAVAGVGLGLGRTCRLALFASSEPDENEPRCGTLASTPGAATCGL